MTAPVVLLIIPVYNEAEVLAAHLATILQQAGTIEPTCLLQMLVVDDGSQDNTPAVLDAFCATHPQVQWIGFTRNFGKEAAIQAGLDHARADAVILLDSDLQHPPRLIPQMVSLWQGGALVVEAVKEPQQTAAPWARLFSRGFYRLFRLLCGMDLSGQSDFKLLDQSVLAQYRRFQESGRFFRGLVQWMHFPSARLTFQVPERAGGATRWSPWALLRYALHSITAFSAVPLQLITWAGAISMLVGVVFAGIALVQKWQGQALDGFTTVILLQIFFSGTLMLCLGIIGHYLARIHQEVKRRPLYVLRGGPR